jgi:hypothetical protein
VLVSGRFLFVRPFPPLQIPNLKAPAVAHQRDLTFQSERSTKFLRQNQAALSICGCVLSARMQVPQENAAISRGNALVRFCSRTRFRELPWRHDKEKLMSRLRQKNEFLRTIAPPAGGNRDSILVVDRMPELSGIETFGWGIGVHWSSGAIVHFAPLDTTFNHLPTRWSIKIFSLFAPCRLDRKLLGS